MVGFHTGKYTSQETPFNVPERIFKSMSENAAVSKKKDELVSNFEQLSIGKSAPDFSLPGLEQSSMVSLTDFRGKVTLLEFWASWCGGCRRSNGYLFDMYEQYQSKNFEIVSISMDRSLRSWKKAIRQDSMNWTQVCDGLGVDSEVMLQYGVFNLPRNFLLDQQGIIIGKDMSVQEIDQWLQKNL